MTVIVDENKALLITWTCYGTWLPGDERGFVSNKLKPSGSFERKINAIGELPHADDPYTRAVTAELQKWPSVYLSPDEAFCVAKSLCEVAQNRQWRIPRAAIMRTHIHVVVRDCPDDGPAVRRVLKGATQADLCELCGFSKSWWTRRGSDRYLNGSEPIETAIKYVAEQEYKLAEVVAGRPYRCRPRPPKRAK